MAQLSSFNDLLTQNAPQFQTRQALIVVGAQDDFLSPKGSLPVSQPPIPSLLSRIRALVPAFRENAGDIIWIRTEYHEDRFPLGSDRATDDADSVVTDFGLRTSLEEIAAAGIDDADGSLTALPSAPRKLRSSQSTSYLKSSAGRSRMRALDIIKKYSARKSPNAAPSMAARQSLEDEDEHFLCRTPRREPCFLPRTHGVEMPSAIRALVDQSSDVMLTTSHYSSFHDTGLLMILRMKLITQLYICGSISNISVFATVADAAKHGMTINLIEDCLGYRKLWRHEEAMRQMTETFGAYTLTSSEILNDLSETPEIPETGSRDLTDMLDHLSLQETTKTAPSQESRSTGPPRTAARTSSSIASHRISRDSHLSSGQVEIVDISAVKDRPQSRTRDRSTAKHLGLDRRHSDRTTLLALEAQTAKAKSKEYVPNRVHVRTRRQKSGESMGGERSRSASLPDSQGAPKLGAIPPLTTGEHPRSWGPVNRKDTASPASAAIASSVMSRSGMREGSASEDKKPMDRGAVGEDNSVSSKNGRRNHPNLSNLPTLGPGDRIGTGDSTVLYDFMPTRLASHPTLSPANIFSRLCAEVRWQRMFHATGEVPRLVCVQGVMEDDGSHPIYRHPSDHVLPLMRFSPAVDAIRMEAEKRVGHPLNHVLIQLYRSGNDYISEHSDKTLDIVWGSKIVNASFGALRTMRLRTKKPDSPPATATDSSGSGKPAFERETQRVPMPHNSLFVLGPDTNATWLHGIQPDKRAPFDRSSAELEEGGARISLTFRHIGTWLNGDESLIWGQGAISREKSEAQKTIHGGEDAKKLIMAFGAENRSSEQNAWEKFYGKRSNVLDLTEGRTEKIMVFLPFPDARTASGERTTRAERIVREYIRQAGLDVQFVEAPAPLPLPTAAKLESAKDKSVETLSSTSILLRDIDAAHTEVTGEYAILMYLARYYQTRPSAVDALVRLDMAADLERTFLLKELDIALRRAEAEDPTEQDSHYVAAALDALETQLTDEGRGSHMTTACVFGVLLADAVCWSGWDRSRWPRLARLADPKD